MMVRAAPLAQCITDERLRILTVDDAYVELLGRPREAIVGRSPLDFTAPPDQSLNDSLLQQLDRDGRAFTITKRYVRGDGSLQWVSNHVSSFRDGLGRRRLLATCEVRTEPEIGIELARLRQDAINMVGTIGSAKRAFGADLIGSPALEALLHLHLAEMEGRSLTPRCIGVLIGQPKATTLRWLKVLEQRVLVEMERAGPLESQTPLRITMQAQRMMETIAGMLPPYAEA
jgi:PAS domain S-box-containing protein